LPDEPQARTSERRLLLLVASVQFVNILDFMIVMPLGPDFAKALGIPMSDLGLVGGSYTAAAAVSGIVASRFLDRFDRKRALAVAMLGLVLGTALGGLATGLYTLVLARILAGAFGGPATSLSMSIVADVIPPERRGRALGTVMGAFSLASVAGVPAGLELARLGGFRLPFFSVAGLGLVVAAFAIFHLPPLRMHMEQASDRPSAQKPLAALVREPTVGLSLLAMFSMMIASFAIIPNLSGYLQHNLGYPRAHIGLLYLVGGVVSFVAMRAIGPMIDRAGATTTASVGTLLFLATLVATFVVPWPGLPVMAIFVTFMTAMAFRGVSFNALASRVPQAHERARYMSIQSSVQHLASALGAVLASQLLHELPDHSLVGMRNVALFAMACGACLPFLLHAVERRVRMRPTPSLR
jgi:predicted MFS family arabinose efflux permease